MKLIFANLFTANGWSDHKFLVQKCYEQLLLIQVTAVNETLLYKLIYGKCTYFA